MEKGANSLRDVLCCRNTLNFFKSKGIAYVRKKYLHLTFNQFGHVMSLVFLFMTEYIGFLLIIPRFELKQSNPYIRKC